MDWWICPTIPNLVTDTGTKFPGSHEYYLQFRSIKIQRTQNELEKKKERTDKNLKKERNVHTHTQTHTRTYTYAWKKKKKFQCFQVKKTNSIFLSFARGSTLGNHMPEKLRWNRKSQRSHLHMQRKIQRKGIIFFFSFLLISFIFLYIYFVGCEIRSSWQRIS